MCLGFSPHTFRSEAFYYYHYFTYEKPRVRKAKRLAQVHAPKYGNGTQTTLLPLYHDAARFLAMGNTFLLYFL